MSDLQITLKGKRDCVNLLAKSIRQLSDAMDAYDNSDPVALVSAALENLEVCHAICGIAWDIPRLPDGVITKAPAEELPF